MPEQKIIIFEGPDGCGKTNIAKELSKRTNIPYFKNHDEHTFFRIDPNYFVNVTGYAGNYFSDYLEQTKASIILDRYWPSEWIYAQLLNRETDMSMLRHLDLKHSELGAIIIIPMRSDYSKVKDTYAEITAQLREIDTLYREFMKWTTCKTVLLNVDDEDLERELAEILMACPILREKQ